MWGRSIRAIWAIQDRITLDTDEEKAVEVKREMGVGQEHVVWNPALSIPAKEFEFSDLEAGRIKAAIETWDSYGANADRRWLEPLVVTLFSTPDFPQTGQQAETQAPAAGNVRKRAHA
jgi:hypothetical protein